MSRDDNKRRFITMPAIPFLRDWMEKQYGNIWEKHDNAYEDAKNTSDIWKADIECCKSILETSYDTPIKMIFMIPFICIIFIIFRIWGFYKFLKRILSYGNE